MIAFTLTAVLTASACSVIGADDEPGDGTASGDASKKVVLVTHESLRSRRTCSRSSSRRPATRS